MTSRIVLAALLIGCQGEEVQDLPAVDAAAETAAETAADTASESSSDAAPDVVTTGCAKPHGPSMVLVDASVAKYCIDTTEVTVRQFNEWISATGAPYDAPAYCNDMKLARPVRDDSPAIQDHPVRSMMWCHAHAYCKWAGKRLCGKIGDKAETFFPADGRSEWVYACQNGSMATRYPYGGMYDGSKCQTGGGGLVAVKSSMQCHGTTAPFDSIYDMTGNAAELDGFITFDTSGAPMSVRTIGRAYGDGDFPCASPAEYGFTGTFPQVGFRCCADP